jgi:50S ribosomal protein L16 3-hydroxylase
MLYDERSLYINGECLPVTGKDAALLRRLANDRRLDDRAARAAGAATRTLLADWFRAGWLHRSR